MFFYKDFGLRSIFTHVISFDPYNNGAGMVTLFIDEETEVRKGY